MDGSKKPSVLIVEDEAVVAQDINDILKNFHYQIAGIAKSGERALEVIPGSHPDIVLMDIHLAGPMDGIETADRIYAEYGIPVIFLTAYADDTLLERAKRTHPFGYIIKPFSERELYSAIEIAIYKAGMEARLRESERKYRTLFEIIPDGFCYCQIIRDDDGYPADFAILEVNPAFLRLTGLSCPTGRKLSGIFSGEPGICGEMAGLCYRVATTGVSESIEVWNNRQSIWLRVLVSRTGKDHILAVFENITESKLATEALRLSNQKLNLLSNITRHDIRNQIHALYGYLGLLKMNLMDGPGAEYVMRGAQIADTIERQIDFTKEYQDLGVQSPVWHSLSACVTDATVSLPMGDIRIDVLTDSLEIFADPLFVKVFYNLIDNSLRHGGQDLSLIRISSRDPMKRLIITIEDDGKGIPADDKQRLFTKGFGKNTGLGLFLSREILAITGIGITETGEPGGGARFEIDVPDGAWRCAGKNTEIN